METNNSDIVKESGETPSSQKSSLSADENNQNIQLNDGISQKKRKTFVIPSISDVREFERKSKTETNLLFRPKSISIAQSSHVATTNTTSTTISAISPQQNAKSSPYFAPSSSNVNSASGFVKASSLPLQTQSNNLQTNNQPPKSPQLQVHQPQQPQPQQIKQQPQQQLQKPALPLQTAYSSSKIIVNNCQKGNRVLQFIKNVPWEFGNIVPDYVMGKDTCALYLSLRFHLLNQEYIYNRTKQLKGAFKCRVLLCLVDVEHSTNILEELTKLSLISDLTLVLAWSNQEVARYLETYKAYENKGPDMIKEIRKEDYFGQLIDSLTVVKGVNKTDVHHLKDNFGSLKGIVKASMEEMSLCPGLGEKKVKRLYETFRQPFASSTSGQRKKSKNSTITTTTATTTTSTTTNNNNNNNSATSMTNDTTSIQQTTHSVESEPQEESISITFDTTRKKKNDNSEQ